MKYLRRFNTEADVQVFVKPNVVLVADTGKVLYNVAPPIGVYIQHIDGSIYTTAEWDANGYEENLANGVAVIANEASFVIAKEMVSESLQWASDTDNAIQGAVLTSDKTAARTDYNGRANTDAIAVIDTMGAAFGCANYIFPNGNKGYLPALGEWDVAYANKTEINAALALIGGTAIPDKYHWTSTQYSSNRAWTRSWGGDFQGNYAKTSQIPVRAFTSL